MSDLGATYLGDNRCCFRVWAPNAQRVELHLFPDGAPDRSSHDQFIQMISQSKGYHEVTVNDVTPGARYMFRLDGDQEYPDPASRFQPEGVHEPSQVVEARFEWQDHLWTGLPLSKYIIYELHVGSFTGEGTFEAVIPHLDMLVELGVTAVEIMPVAQFPGSRNWGYDGAYPYAVQNSYGGPVGLKRLVDACHQAGLAVILDVVYNHMGPEGGYLGNFGPYFTERYQTGWGSAINYDGPHSDEVRHFFIQNALYWLTEFHFDALRLDAVHSIFDPLAQPFVQELAETVERQGLRLGRRTYLIAESALNNPRLIQPPERGGYGLDAQWNDDFHHAFEARLIGDRSRYSCAFGSLQDIVRACSEGYVYTGQYSALRQRRHGRPPELAEGYRFVIFLQNHDQVGNRPQGSRLHHMISLDEYKVAVSLMLLSPFTPLLFMGEEYGETAPFYYFVSFSDPALVKAVQEGRQQEMAELYGWEGELYDPQAESTLRASRLNHHLRREGEHRVLFDFYKELIRLRRELPALASLNLAATAATAWEREQALVLRRWRGEHEAYLICSFNREEVTLSLPLPSGRWRKRLDSALPAWLGQGQASPEVLESDGEVQFRLSPNSCSLWVRNHDVEGL